MSKNFSVETHETLVNPDIQSRIDQVHDYWAGRSFRDVVAEMPAAQPVAIDDMRDVQLVEIEPRLGEADNSRAILLAQPYLNGYTPHHYIRAKTLQLLAGPNHSVWLLPNSVDRKPAYTFTAEEKARLAEGNMLPFGEVFSRAFEVIDRQRKYGLGALSIAGYSQGGLTSLAMGATSAELNIERINADETPSMTDRDSKTLRKHFQTSTGLTDLPGAVKDAGIHALSQAMNLPRLSLDLARFGKATFTSEAKLLNEAMKGSADYLVERAVAKGILVKLGYVAGSHLFDPESITTESEGLKVVRYDGTMFNRKHATGDNVIAHAVMADQGLRRR